MDPVSKRLLLNRGFDGAERGTHPYRHRGASTGLPGAGFSTATSGGVVSACEGLSLGMLGEK